MARIVHLNLDHDSWLLSGPGGPNDSWPEDSDGRPLTEAEIDDIQSDRDEWAAYLQEMREYP